MTDKFLNNHKIKLTGALLIPGKAQRRDCGYKKHFCKLQLRISLIFLYSRFPHFTLTKWLINPQTIWLIYNHSKLSVDARRHILSAFFYLKKFQYFNWYISLVLCFKDTILFLHINSYTELFGQSNNLYIPNRKQNIHARTNCAVVFILLLDTKSKIWVDIPSGELAPSIHSFLPDWFNFRFR